MKGCAAVSDIIESKVGIWGFLGLSDGQISGMGAWGDTRNYRIRTDGAAWQGTWSICLSGGSLSTRPIERQEVAGVRVGPNLGPTLGHISPTAPIRGP